MEQDNIAELIRIFRQLSPNNQRYLLSLAQVAAVAESAAKLPQKPLSSPLSR